MILLAVDIGNTNVTLGFFDGERLAHSWRVTTRPDATTDDEAAVLVSHLLALDGHALEEIDAVAIASVVPPLTGVFERLARERLGLAPLVVDPPALGTILPIQIQRPAEVGVDRVLNALAVHTERGGPAIVLDLGTAATFDVVAADGAYIGGAIAPGPAVSLEALHRAASKLPRVELRRPPQAIGTDTVSAMQSGVVNGYIGLVTGLLTALRAELLERSPEGSRVTVVATGGHALEPWLADVPGIDALEPELTLRGLRLAHARLAAGRVEATR